MTQTAENLVTFSHGVWMIRWRYVGSASHCSSAG